LKIYTKTGDDGKTNLQSKKRVSKSNPRILAYGAIDEINSAIGIVLSHDLDDDIQILLTQIQNELFVAGADLSNPELTDKKNRITENMIEVMEQKIDNLEKEVSPLTNFILPGGHITASNIHLARTITRRAESLTVALSSHEKINEHCQIYLNRLSDLLFVLARVINKRTQKNDIVWKP